MSCDTVTTFPIDFTGHPAISIPAGLTPEVSQSPSNHCRKYADESVLALASRARRTLKGSDFGAILAAEVFGVCRGIALDWRKSWQFRSGGRGGSFLGAGAVIPSRIERSDACARTRFDPCRRRERPVPQPARQPCRHATRTRTAFRADRLEAFRRGVRRALRREGPARVADAADGRAASDQTRRALSDEQVCAQWLENAYFQYFTGETYFQTTLPLDRTSMSVWRGASAPTSSSADCRDAGCGQTAGAVEVTQMQRVTIDTTAQTKAVAHPTDSHLLLRAIEWLNRAGEEAGRRPSASPICESPDRPARGRTADARRPAQAGRSAG